MKIIGSATVPDLFSSPELPAEPPGSDPHGLRPASIAADGLAGGAPRIRQTPGLASQAARTIQRVWRGHASRRVLRQAAVQDEMVRVCRRQSELCDLGARLPPGMALHPALLGEAAPSGTKRRRGTAAEMDTTPPCAMSVEQRLLRLKELYAELWACAQDEVTPTHSAFLHRQADRALNVDQRRRLLAQVRDDLFVAALPEVACWQAGFFAASHRPVVVRRRTFRPPAVDVRMKDV